MNSSLPNKTRLVKIGEAAKILGVSIDTLRRWEKTGKIESVRTPGGTRLYPVKALKNFSKPQNQTPKQPSYNKPAAQPHINLSPLTRAQISEAKTPSIKELLKSIENSTTLSQKPVLPVNKFLKQELLETNVFNLSDDKTITTNNNKTLQNTSFIQKAFLSLSGITVILSLAFFFLTYTQPDLTNKVLTSLSPIAEKLHVQNLPDLITQNIRNLHIPDKLFPNKQKLKDEAEIPKLVLDINNQVLAASASAGFLLINADVQIDGNLSVNEVNSLVFTPTTNGLSISSATASASLIVTNDVSLDQNLSRSAAPTFSTLNLSSTTNQLVFQSGGPTGTLTWTPTAASIITLPDVTTTLVGIDTTQTLTNKTISGSSNTLTNIPNSALTNKKVTVTAGSGLSGGGDVELGSSKSLSIDTGVVTTLTGTQTLTNKTLTAPVINVGSDATGDVYYRDSAGLFQRLAIGTTNQVLSVAGGIPSWQATSSICTNCILTDPSATQTITPTAAAATGLSVAQAALGSVDIFNVTNNGGSTKHLKVDSSGNTTAGGTFTSTGAGTFSSSLDVTGISTFTGNVNANGGLDVDDAFVVADGGALTTSQTATFNGAFDANGQFDLGDGGDAGTISATTLDIDATGALQINSSGGAIFIGNDAVAQNINIGTGAAARTITMGNNTGATALALTSGTGSQTFTSSVVSTTGTSSAFVFNDAALTTGTLMYLQAAAVTTGNLLDINTGSSIFSISNTALTTSLPTNFTSSGDVSIAYDITFTNPTASFVKSLSALNIVAGDTYTSSNLTLQTYNQGTVVVDTAATTGTSMNLLANGVTTGTGLLVNANALTTGTAVSISSTSTAGGASGSSYLLNLSRSGANSNTAHTAYGISSSVTNTNGTSGTNVGGLFTASGATTANYSLQTSNLTAAASATNAHLLIGTTSGTAASSTNSGITIGAISSTGTANYGINIGAISGAATTNYGINIGAVSGGTTNYAIYSAGGQSVHSGNVRIGSTTAPTVALDVTGAALISSTLGVTGDTTLTGDLAINGGDLTTTATTFNLLNATATTINFAGAATSLSIGASSGTTTVNNALTVTGATTLNGNVQIGDAVGDTLTIYPTTLAFLKENAHTIQIADSTTANTAGGALTIKSAAGVGTGAGGALTITAGTSGTTGATGGSLTLSSGPTNTGGAANLGTSGNVTLTVGGNDGGGSEFQSGSIAISTKDSVGSNRSGGAITVTTGAGAAASGGGGAFSVTTGAGGSTASVGATAGTGGALSFTSGAGGTNSSGSSGDGGVSGAISIITGTGGIPAGASTGGNSGAITLRTGAPGTGGTAGSILFQTSGSTTRATIDTSGLTLAANHGLTFSSGTGTYSQTFTGTTTNPFAISASAITTGNVLDLSSTSTAATSSDLIQGDHTATYTAATTVSGNLLDLSRALTINATATTLTVSGALASLTDNCTATAGTCTHTGNVLSLTQSYASSTGTVLALSNAGSGMTISVTDDDLIGLGTGAGRIEFDDQTTDEINFLNANVGIGTSTPAFPGGLHILTTGDGAGNAAGVRIDNSFGGSTASWAIQIANTYNKDFVISEVGVNDFFFIERVTGEVGIGDATPDYLLDVAGTLGVDGNTTLGDSNTADTLTGNLLTSTITSGATTQNAVAVTADSLITGTTLALSSTATSFNGELLTLSKTGASGSTAFTSDIANITYSQTFNGGVGLNSTGNVLDISRAITLNNVGNTHTISGALVTISDTMTQTAGTLTHTANVVDITQSYASSTGTVLALSNAGSGMTISVTDDDLIGLGTGAGRIEFDDQATDEVNILDANVGIGTTSPSTFKLQVAGSIGPDADNIYDLGAASPNRWRDIHLARQINFQSSLQNITMASGKFVITGSATGVGNGLLDVVNGNASTVFAVGALGTVNTVVTSSNVTNSNHIAFGAVQTINGSSASQTYYGQKLAITNNQTTNADTVYGTHITFTDAGTLANSVTGLYVDTTTANANDTTYAAIFQGGNIGIGDTTPAALLTVGSGDLFQVNSSGAIAAATGITSSGTISFTDNVDLGATSADTITLNGVVDSNLTFIKEVARTIQIADSTTADTAGGALTIKSGAGAATNAAGGALSLAGGAGAGTGAGGAINLTAGSTTVGVNSSGSGGAIALSAGTGSANGSGGAVSISAGTLNAGNGILGSGGAISITAGSVISAINSGFGPGGAITITSGSGSSTSTAAINGGGSGAVTLSSAAGGTATTGTGGAAGTVAITGGNGGTVSSSGTGGAGGAVNITAGNSGSATGGTAGNAGAITLTGGTGALTKAGGAISLSAGQGGATAAGGAVTIASGAGGSSSGTSGALSLLTGTAASGAQSGTVTLRSGNTTAADSGATTISTGTTTTSGVTGALTLSTGNSAGNSGSITIDPGTSSSTVGSLLIGNTNARTITIGSSSATGVSITDDSWSITAAGAATFGSTLNVTGITTLTGNLNANGGFDVDDIFVVADGGAVTANTDVDFTLASGENFTISHTTPTTDAIAASLGTSSTDGVDGLQLTFGVSNASGNVIDITPSYSDTAAVSTSETYNIIDIDAFTATQNATGDTGSINALAVGALTQTETAGTITAYALNIGSGWDSVLRVNGTEVINGSGQVVSSQITGTLFTAAGDTGSATIIQGDTLTVAGGTNGIDTSHSGDTITLNLDTTEIGTTTFGSGSGFTWTFDAGATDPTIAFASDQITLTVGTFAVTGAQTISSTLAVNGNTTLGDLNTADTLTGNLLTTAITSGATTQTAFSISGTGFTTGELLDLTATYAPTDGSTNEAIDINITHTPTVSADNFQSFNLTTTDGTALGNTVYNQQNTLTLTGNAAKTGIGIYSTVTSSSTTADTLYAGQFATAATGALSTGTRTVYGINSAPASTGASTGGTLNLYGSYLAPTSTLSNPGVTDTTANNVYGQYITTTATLAADCTTNCTTNQYGLYVANGTSSTNGTSTKYGLYVESPTGADTNYAAIFAGGNVGIADTSPAALFTVGSGDLFQVNSTGQVGVGATAATDRAIFVNASNLTSTNQYGVVTIPATNSNATSAGYGVWSRVDTAAATFTQTNNYAFYAANPSKGSGSTITNAYGLHIEALTAGTNNYALCFDCDGTWTSSTVAAGIQFGTDANGVNLYRSASDTLKTDDNLVVGTDLTVSGGDITGANGESIDIGEASNGTISFLIDATSGLNVGSTGISSIGNVAHTIVNSSGALNIDSNSTGAINIGTGANAKTITIGNNTTTSALAFTSGTGSQTFTSSVVSTTGTSSAFVFNDAALTTGTLMYLQAAAVTTGNLLDINTGSSIFSISNTALTTSLPTNFTSSGDVSIAYDINLTNPTASYIKSSAPLYIQAGPSYANNDLTLQTFGTGSVIVSQSIATTGSPTAFNVTGAAHTTLTASTEATDINLNLARTVQFATGALTNQRAVQVSAPTYGFVGASTLTSAATFYIDRAPQAGTNATITNAYSLWVDAGNTRLDGDLEVNDGDITTSATTATLFNTTATTLSLGGAATTALNLGNGSGNYTAINIGSGTGTHTINIAGTGATGIDTINIGTGGTAADTINIGTAATANTIAIGSSSTTSLSLTDDSWSITAAGAANFAGNVGIGDTTPAALLTVGNGDLFQVNSSGNINQVGAATSGTPALTGAWFQQGARTFTDNATAASGTATNMVFNSFAVPTLAASNLSVTTTNAANFYIAGAPTPGTNQTITNTYALWVDAGTTRLDGAVAFGAQATFTDLDATPDVSAGSHFITNTSAVTITDFDAGSGTLQAGQIIFVESNGAITYDCAPFANLNCGGADIVTAAKDLTAWIYDGTDWTLINWMKNASTQTGADLAEWYVSSDNLEPGDVVSINQNEDVVVQKSTQSYESKALGIVTTNPGIILGSQEQHTFAVALAGRVPTKVSTENGPIQRGDYLTSSSTPGVAMKATKPGPVIGKALENYGGDCFVADAPRNDVIASPEGARQSICQGKIMTFVNVSYADPGNFLASLSLDNEGNLISPKIKTENIVISTTIDISRNDGKGLLSYATRTNTANQPTYEVDVISSLKNLEEAVINTQDKQATDSAKLADLAASTSTQSAALANLRSQVASLAGQIATSSATPGNDVADLNLTPPDLLIATGSATLADLKVTSSATISGQLVAYDLSVQNIFKSLGTTTLGATNIAGDLNIDGTLSISHNSLNSLTTLYLQNSPLAQGVDFFNGLVTIDNTGKLTAQTISAKEYLGVSGATLGSGKIVAETKTVTISSTLVKTNSRILITPTSETSQPISVVAKTANTSFTVSMPFTTTTDINFDWFIINESQ